MKDIKEIINIISSYQHTENKEVFCLTQGNKYISYPFNPKNINEINEDQIQDSLILAIDGSNKPIISTPNFSIHLIQIYYSLFLKDKKINLNIQKIQYYLFAYTHITPNNKQYYRTITIPLNSETKQFFKNKEDIEIDAFDKTLNNLFKNKIDVVGDISRRLNEWNYIKHILKTIQHNISIKNTKNTLILLDGSLQTTYPYELEISEKIYTFIDNLNKKQTINLLGVIKSSGITTNTGLNATTYLYLKFNNLFPNRPLYYKDWIVSNNPEHKAKIIFSKLHKNSKRVFRIDSYTNNPSEIKSLIATLSSNSNDLALLGYPYALLDVDRNIKITEKDISYHKNKISIELKKHNLDSLLIEQDIHQDFDFISKNNAKM